MRKLPPVCVSHTALGKCALISDCLVLRMLSKYVGEETFLKGVSIYLKKHLFSNSVTRDLWDGIAEASGEIHSS